MESKYNASAMAMKDVLPLQTLLEAVSHRVGIPKDVVTILKKV